MLGNDYIDEVNHDASMKVDANIWTFFQSTHKEVNYRFALAHFAFCLGHTPFSLTHHLIWLYRSAYTTA